jgi:hypothetical protein
MAHFPGNLIHYLLAYPVGENPCYAIATNMQALRRTVPRATRFCTVIGF